MKNKQILKHSKTLEKIESIYVGGEFLETSQDIDDVTRAMAFLLLLLKGGEEYASCVNYSADSPYSEKEKKLIN